MQADPDGYFDKRAFHKFLCDREANVDRSQYVQNTRCMQKYGVCGTELTWFTSYLQYR